MKTSTLKIISAALVVVALFTGQLSFAQNTKLGVLNIDSKGIILDAQQLGNLLRIEVEKTEAFKVIDNYDATAIATQANIKLSECFAKSCLIDMGKRIGADKMLSGSAERYNERIIITLRIIDVASGNAEKTQVSEFLNLQPEMQNMLAITFRTMQGLKNDEELVKRLTKSSNYESATNNPGTKRLRLSGPRMGATVLFGQDGKRLTASESQGGYDAFPVMSQFGYQFETQYLNSGSFQALVEYIPLITGIDQGMFIPSFTLLNGFRNNETGWELAFGPTFSISKLSEGYYNKDGEWIRVGNSYNGQNTEAPTGVNVVKRNDSRGDLTFVTGWVFAVGKTFKSGQLNIPVNFYIMPSKGSTRIGVSFGFNNKR